jgi:hypothetical protein
VASVPGSGSLRWGVRNLDKHVCVRYLDGMTLDETIDPQALIAHLDGSDADTSDALEAVGLLRGWLEELEEKLVLRARVEGLSWHGIGTALRRSKQSVWEKYHDPDPGDIIDG